MSPDFNTPSYQFETPEGIRIEVLFEPSAPIDGRPTMNFRLSAYPAPGYTITSHPTWRQHDGAAVIHFGSWATPQGGSEESHDL